MTTETRLQTPSHIYCTQMCCYDKTENVGRLEKK